MTGKIKKFNVNSLITLNTFALLLTSYFFKNFFLIGCFLIFFCISSITTKYGLGVIKKFNLLQNIREEGPASHFYKTNTPTIGGIFIIIPFLILLLIIIIKFYSIKILLLFFCILSFFLIGFLDDYLSIKNKNNNGLNPKEKFILQSSTSLIFIFLSSQRGYIDPQIIISNRLAIDISIMIIPLSFITLVGLSNAVNLTDGLDGLASGCSSIVFYGLGTEILLKGQKELIIFSILCYSMSGLCLGFLLFNKHPAKIFMGDTGSLSIGAILGSISILTNSFLSIFIFSGIFFAESLSVIFQVCFFKITRKFFRKGKRLFLMAPLHHHFELKGFKEEVIVQNFWKINVLLVVSGIVLKISI